MSVWKPQRLAVSATGYWQLGPLSLYVRRQEQEWQVAYRRSPESSDDTAPLSYQANADPPPSDAELARYAQRATDGLVKLEPVLADRPVVMRPATALHIPSGEAVSLYVSTPLWVRIAVSMPPSTLCELPVQRLSDTWLGPSTMEGTLCYDSRSRARLQVRELPTSPYRAITPVTVRNQHAEPLLLERLALPMENLALYATERERFWTQGITVVRESDGDMGAVELARDTHANMPDGHQVAQPRRSAERRTMVHAISMLFGS